MWAAGKGDAAGAQESWATADSPFTPPSLLRGRAPTPTRARWPRSGTRPWPARAPWCRASTTGEGAALAASVKCSATLTPQLPPLACFCPSACPLCQPAAPQTPPFPANLTDFSKDGSKFLNKLQVSPLYGADGQVSHLLGVLTPEELPAVAPAPAAAAAAPASDAARPRQAAGGVPRA